MSATMAKTISVRIDDELESQFDEYLSQHRFEPNQSDVVREALTEFLAEELDEAAADSGA